MRIDELRTTLREQADEVSAADEVGVQQRNAAVQRRVHAAHGRRRAGVAAVLGVLALAVVGGLVVVPPLLPTPAPRTAGTDEPMVETPPRLAGWPMPALLQVGSRSYSYLRGEQTRDDRNLLRVAVGQSPKRQIIAWSTSPGTQSTAPWSAGAREARSSTAPSSRRTTRTSSWCGSPTRCPGTGSAWPSTCSSRTPEAGAWVDVRTNRADARDRPVPRGEPENRHGGSPGRGRVVHLPEAQPQSGSGRGPAQGHAGRARF
jgi:hypothetical protein